MRLKCLFIGVTFFTIVQVFIGIKQVINVYEVVKSCSERFIAFSSYLLNTNTTVVCATSLSIHKGMGFFDISFQCGLTTYCYRMMKFLWSLTHFYLRLWYD